MTDAVAARPGVVRQSSTSFVPPQPEKPTWSETLGAGFRQENDVLNLLEAMGRERFAPEEDFSVFDALEASPLGEEHWRQLGGARSRAEFEQLEARITREKRDREILAAAGLGGMAAGMGGALFSPVMFIPLVGSARGAKGVTQAFALAAAAASGQELVLLETQLLRTPSETFAGIAAGTVLGGILGSAAVMLRKADFDRAAADMAPGSDPGYGSQLIRTEDGQYLRTGPQAEMQLPRDMPPPPGVVRQVEEARQQVREVLAAVRQGTPLEEARAARTLSTEATTLLNEVLAQPPRPAEAQVAAQAAGFSEQTAQAWSEVIAVRAQLDEAQPQITRADLQQAEARFAEALQEEGRVTRADKLKAREELTGAALAARNEDELLGPVLQTRTEVLQAQGASVGAARRGETPEYVRNVRQADGTMTYELITDTDPGKFANPLMVGRLAGMTSPVFRLTNQDASPSLRRIQQNLADGGMLMEGNLRGIAHAEGGTLEASSNAMAQGLLFQAMKAIRENYTKYLFKGKPTTFQRFAQLPIAKTFDTRLFPDKMTFMEFKVAVRDATNHNAVHEVSEVAAASSELRKVYDHVLDYAKEIEDALGIKRGSLLPERAMEETESYMTHHWSQRIVSEKYEKAKLVIKDHIEGLMTARAERQLQKLRDRLEADDTYAEVLLMEEAEVKALRADFKTQLDEANRVARDSQAVERIDELQSQLPELRKEARALRKAEAQLKPEERARLQELTDEIDSIENQVSVIEQRAPEAEIKAKARASKARKMLRALDAGAVRLAERQAELFSRIEHAEDLNIRALERLTNDAQRLMRQVDKIDNKKLDAEIAKLEAQFEKAAKQLESGEARMDRLRERFGPEGTEFEPTERLSVEQFRQDRRAAKLQRTFDRLDESTNFDREAARQSINDKLQLAIEYTNRVNSRRSERVAKLREQAKRLDPEAAKAQAAKLKERGVKRLEDFEENIRKQGAVDIRVTPTEGRFSFGEMADDAAELLTNQIAGASGRMSQLDQLRTVEGFRKWRMLDINYEKKREFLEPDVERTIDTYLRSTIPDLHLHERFGAANFEEIFEPVRADFQRAREHLATRTVDDKGKVITPARREQELLDFNKQSASLQNQLRAQIDRLRNQRGMPADGNSVAYRLGRFVMNLNVPMMMGVAAITSIPDAARSVMVHGLTNTFRDGWTPFVKSLTDGAQWAEVKHAIGELQLGGIGTELYSQARATAQLDLFNGLGGNTKVERTAEWLAKMTPQVALFGQWTDMMKVMSGTVAMARVSRAVQAVVEGTATPNQLQVLNQSGISDSLARRIYAQMSTPDGGAKFRDTLVPSTQGWTDPKAVRAFRAAMKHFDERTVITPGMERPLISDENILGRMLFQFRSFTMASNTKMLISGLQQRDMGLFHALQGTVFSLALGTLSYYIWAATAGERQFEEMRNASWQVWLDQAIYRSGLLGAFSEVQSIGSTLNVTRPYVMASGGDLAGRRPDNFLGAVAGPTFGTAWSVSQLLNSLDEPTQGTVRQARKLLPYQNLFYLRRALDMVEEGLGDAMNLPERRGQ